MEFHSSKVFSSNIIRSNTEFNNDLYEILKIVPVQPIPQNPNETEINYEYDFVPTLEKVYVPKRRMGRKVRTVRDIRNAYEKDVFSYLPSELEKQRNILLRKIRYGFSKTEKTRELATNMINSDTPISKPAWQMLMNINPEDHKFSRQYILWNKKCIQINGSKGGQNKFICNYDVGILKSSQKKAIPKSTILSRKRQLLHHSLNVKFKPGPLSKKRYLEVSNQKYQLAEIELVNLPRTSLEVETSYGKPLPPVIDTFINKYFFQSDGLITQKWANFAVSVLGKNKKGIASRVEINKDPCVTFDLNYKCFQKRILMRHDSDIVKRCKYNETSITTTPQEDLLITSEVRNVMDNVLNAVEISFKQDEMYTREDEPREIIPSNNSISFTHPNNKCKRKGELRRLDVTVITISETTEPGKTIMCQNDYCALGCVCDSLKCAYNFTRHCGRIECMFNCKCDFSKYKYVNSFDNDYCSDIITGLINLDKKLSQTLAKEEHKFHQTVIVTDDRSILLKSDRRNWKVSKKYADFYSNMHLKTEHNTIKPLSIVCPNLNCKNVEPWCLVHKLYKCFCKGKFTESGLNDLEEIKICEKDNGISKLVSSTSDTLNAIDDSKETIDNVSLTNDVTNTRLRRARRDLRPDICNKKYVTTNEHAISDNNYSSICARAQPYNGRKYKNEYYHVTNKRILEMEKNDKTLHKKIMSKINNDDYNAINTEEDDPSNLKELLSNAIENSSDCNVKDTLPDKSKLVDWLEKSYKQYKLRADQGLFKVTLDPPKTGRLGLYSWEFILSRYRERKNYFFISKQKPYRIFMAIDINNEFFDSCSNISDINLSDIDKYPVTIKNLLTNATDLKENFCILCGLAHCWELIGSVTKVNENRGTVLAENQKDKLIISEEKLSEINASDDSYNLEDLPIVIGDDTCELKHGSCIELPESPISKWLVMKIEHDFSEIQFFKKGFFVKYESIVKSINVARVSGKTVRLSSQRCSVTQNNPQFGIYAIPSNEDCCVFIGPYEKDESIGIRAIKKVRSFETVIPQFHTRGTWITTNKVDNLKVIDNPLLFIPTSCLNKDRTVILDNDSTVKDKETANETIDQTDVAQASNTNESTIKVVKPIKIRKTNGFYHLTPNGLLKPIQSPEKDVNNKSSLMNRKFPNINSSLSMCCSTTKQGFTNNRSSKPSLIEGKAVDTKVTAAIFTHSKVNVNIPKEQNKRLERMFILKPEEINERSLKNMSEQPETIQEHIIMTSDNRDDIENDIDFFLATSVACTEPRIDEVYEISDDENDTSSSHCLVEESCKNVWIVCKNIENIGWIAGKKNSENCISFEFPGFSFSIFYSELEALNQISELFANKVYVPKHIELQWQVLESEAEIQSIKKLEEKYLASDYILTKTGLRHKFEVMTSLKSFTAVGSSQTSEIENDKESLSEDFFKQKTKIINDLEETSQTLEDESSFLWDETISRKGEILESFSEASEELRSVLTDQLNCIINKTED